jgi:hypothetical protein
MKQVLLTLSTAYRFPILGLGDGTHKRILNFIDALFCVQYSNKLLKFRLGFQEFEKIC